MWPVMNTEALASGTGVRAQGGLCSEQAQAVKKLRLYARGPEEAVIK
jgi:hypothetical protein